MSIARLAARLALCAVPTAAPAQQTFDIAIFEPPPGWQREVSPERLMLRAPAGDAQIALFASFPSSASAADNFAAEWVKLITAPLGAVPEPQVTTERSPDGWTAVVGATNVAREGANVAVIQVTATGFGRAISVIAYVGSEARVGEVTQFFDGIDFRADATSNAAVSSIVGATAGRPGSAAVVSVVPIPAAVVAENGPIGLFHRTSVGNVGGSRVELDTRLFLPGQRIARVFPFGGGDTFDTSRCSPDTCGTYELSGGALTVRWDDGRVDRWNYERTAAGIRLGGAEFEPARPLSAAALAGEWFGAQDAGSSLANVYQFEPDGRFSFGSGTTRFGGRYRVEGSTLILKFDDGDERRRTLLRIDGGEPAGLIGVDNDVYARR